MDSEFSVWSMLVHGWPVLSVLGIASIFTWAIVYDRWQAFRRGWIDPWAFVSTIVKVLEKQGTAKALEYCKNYTKPIAEVVADTLLQPGNRDDKERAMRHAIQKQVHYLQARVPVLGTIGSMAPFVGLFGTVIGVIKAFRDIAVSSGGGPEVVSAGIAEALVSTAIGLLVAIPAVVGFNYCVHRVQKMADEMDLAVFEVIEKLSDLDSTYK